MTDKEIQDTMKKIESLKPGIWYNISGRPDATNLIQMVKLLIDCHRVFGGNKYILANGYDKFMRKTG